MDNNKFKLNTKIELIRDSDLSENLAESSISLNPQFQWAKIVVTDDIPNANKNRIPLEEFDNIIRSGISTPIKMSFEEVSDGHEEAYGHPIGVIAHLTKETNKVIALAALWKEERPEDIQLLKEMYEDGNAPNVSWELSYTESKSEESGIEALIGVSLNGLAVVGKPAYEGRTSFIAMSSKNQEGTSVEELEKLKLKVEKLDADLETKNAEFKTQLEEKDAQINEHTKELKSLRQFKSEIEKEEQEAEKLANIKKLFEDAGLEKEDEFFDEKKILLLSLEEAALDFMIQEMVAFSELISDNDEDEDLKETSENKTKVPNLKDKTKLNIKNPKELAEAVREYSAAQ